MKKVVFFMLVVSSLMLNSCADDLLNELEKTNELLQATHPDEDGEVPTGSVQEVTYTAN